MKKGKKCIEGPLLLLLSSSSSLAAYEKSFDKMNDPNVQYSKLIAKNINE